MTTEGIDVVRGANYEIAEAIAIALALRDLWEAERADVRADVGDALSRFAAGDGYDLPCVALCAVGS